MLSVKITTFDWQKLARFEQFAAISFSSALNAPGKASFRVPVNDVRVSEETVTILLKIDVYYKRNNNKYKVWSGVVSDVFVNDYFITYVAIDYIGFTQYRALRAEYDNTASVQWVLNSIYSSLDSTHPIPFSIWSVEQAWTDNYKFAVGTSLYSVLSSLAEKNNMVFRIVWGELSMWSEIGDLLQWARKSNRSDAIGSNIVDWSWSMSLNDFYNVAISRDKNAWSQVQISSDNDSISENTVIERFSYDPEWFKDSTKWEKVKSPTMVIDSKKEKWRELSVWDRKAAKITATKDFASIRFVSTIQEIQVEAAWWKINVQISVSQDYKKSKWLDSVLRSIGEKIEKVEINSQ